ncbi:MAG: cytochrome D1 domain-containing protein [Arenicellales bacterium]|nr:cytochrome D1 domain-containing protein [Arenicellales bacterium]
MRSDLLAISLSGLLLTSGCTTLRGTGDMGIVVERADGRVKVVEHTGNTELASISGLGDLSHASAVYSRDGRYAYVFGRDGGLTKIDLLKGAIVKRVMQSGNSIGGAISQDGKLIAVSNYEPGGVNIFDAESLQLIAEIPATYDDGTARSKVVGLVDAPKDRFVFSLYEAGEIWVADVTQPENPAITRYRDVGKQPYDALLTPDGRYYMAGLFGEDGLAMLDLWHPERGVTRILPDYGRGEEKLPVYKMPHLEGWAIAGNTAFVPAVGRYEVLVIDFSNFSEKARIPVHGQPIFVMAQPASSQVWVNFAMPNNDTVQVIDTETFQVIKTLKPGPAVLHMEFTPRGERVWMSVRDDDRIAVYDTTSFEQTTQLPVDKPSGIFFSTRAHNIGL